MAFNDLELKRINNAITDFMSRRRPPETMRGEIDCGWHVRGHCVELFYIRPQWDDPGQIHEYPFAKATFVRSQNVWKIYWRRSDLKWHGYGPAPQVKSIGEFVKLVDEDVCCCFFG